MAVEDFRSTTKKVSQSTASRAYLCAIYRRSLTPQSLSPLSPYSSTYSTHSTHSTLFSCNHPLHSIPSNWLHSLSTHSLQFSPIPSTFSHPLTDLLISSLIPLFHFTLYPNLILHSLPNHFTHSPFSPTYLLINSLTPLFHITLIPNLTLDSLSIH